MSNSRMKGKVGELEVVHLFRRWFPDARRGARQSGGGSEGADVLGTPYWIEVKRRKRSLTVGQWFDAWMQAQRDMYLACERGNIPDLQPTIVVARHDNHPWTVMCHEDLLRELGYRGPAKRFTGNKRVSFNDVAYLVAWPDFAAMLDKHFAIQTDLTKELVA